MQTNSTRTDQGTQIIPSLPMPEMAAQERSVRAIIARALATDLDLDAAAGLLLLAGCTWEGAKMWRNLIALQRALLVAIPAGEPVEVW